MKTNEQIARDAYNNLLKVSYYKTEFCPMRDGFNMKIFDNYVLYAFKKGNHGRPVEFKDLNFENIICQLNKLAYKSMEKNEILL